MTDHSSTSTASKIVRSNFPTGCAAFLGSLPRRTGRGWLIRRSFKARWARGEALPQIARLIEQGRIAEAFALAVQAERYIPDDPMLAKFRPAISWVATIDTKPIGVSVFRRNYKASDQRWELAGRSPVDKHRLPLVDTQWRFELKGYAPAERATVFMFREGRPPDSLSVTMDEEAKAPAGMVHQTDALTASFDLGSLQDTPATLVGLPGFEDAPAIPGAIVVVKQAVRAKQYLWAAGFVGMALLLNPIVPIFTPAGNLILLLSWVGLSPVKRGAGILRGQFTARKDQTHANHRWQGNRNGEPAHRTILTSRRRSVRQ